MFNLLLQFTSKIFLIFSVEVLSMFNRVHEYRKKRNRSQKEVANSIGITRQTVSLIELGKYNPSLKLCIALAQYLETDLNTLFWRDTNEN